MGHVLYYTGDVQEALGHYRRVRDEIRRFVEGMPGNIQIRNPNVEIRNKSE